MRATLLPRQARRGQELELCTRVDGRCEYPGWRRDASRRVWTAARLAHPANYQRKCELFTGPREDREGIATVPASDSYPHVTCGWRSEASARGIIAVSAPRTESAARLTPDQAADAGRHHAQAQARARRCARARARQAPFRNLGSGAGLPAHRPGLATTRTPFRESFRTKTFHNGRTEPGYGSRSRPGAPDRVPLPGGPGP